MAQRLHGSSNGDLGSALRGALRRGGLVAICLLAFACGDDDDPAPGGTGGSGTGGRGGAGGASSGGTGGSQTGGTGGGTGGTASGGTGGGADAGGGTGGSADAGGGDRSDAGEAGGGDMGGGEAGAAPLPPAGSSPLTQGFTQRMPMWNIQSPRNVPRSERYKYDEATGVHTMINYSTDEAFQAGNNTDPRTEFRWTNEYGNSGQHMFDADLFLVPGSNRSCIMQVFGSASSATTLMLTAWADGSIRRYFGGEPPPEILIAGAAGRWLNLKVLHDASAGTLTVYENDKMVWTGPDRGGNSHHFKNGVYGTTMRSETRWRNIRYWVK
jgi:hypothetical protein